MAQENPSTHSAAFIERLLDVIENDVVPVTDAAVRDGNKLFGAAIIRTSDLSLVAADTNRELEWPLLHGEVSCLRTWNSMPAESRPEPKDCYFIATHEPCSLCLSAITWSGFDNFYYLFSYEDTRDAFNIPHDLKILQEVFKCDHGDYARQNAFWTAYNISELIEGLEHDESEHQKLRVTRLRNVYDGMSSVYQESKANNGVPLS